MDQTTAPNSATPDAARPPLEFPRRPWVAIVANPFSGSGTNRLKVDRLQKFLADHGMPVIVIWDRKQREQVLHHPQLADFCACVVVAGCDGTVADVFNHTQAVPLAVLPLGTENLMAKYLGFTDGPEALGLAILEGRHRAIDLGRWQTSSGVGDGAQTNSRLFALMVSAGLDAEVVHKLMAWRTQPTDGSLRRVRRASYLRPTLAGIWGYQYPRVVLEADGKQHEGVMAMVFSVPRYALNLPFIIDGNDCDGKFDWVVFRDGGPQASIGYLLSVLRRAHHDRADVMWGSSASIRLTASTPVPLQSDGDPIGHTPVEINMLPGALRVIVARGR